MCNISWDTKLSSLPVYVSIIRSSNFFCGPYQPYALECVDYENDFHQRCGIT